MKKTNKLTLISLLVAQAIILHIFERMIPIPFIAPGAKLGLSNIITVISLYTLDIKSCFAIVITRVLLTSFLGGSLSSIFYSLAGGLLSLFAMYLLKKAGKSNISVIGVSILGSFFHNLAQIIVSIIILQNINLLVYFPILSFTGMLTGLFIGIVCTYLLNISNKNSIFKYVDDTH